MGIVECDCHLWCTHGYPCRHMFFAMKHEHLEELPQRLDGKELNEYVEKVDDDGDRGFLLRHGVLHSTLK
ncbi:hypothetical protein Ahy_B08g092578 isoform B [Arachis hypogaea]|uniref:SWIM-type domain-containing protein n=1 Tax=Arachis hypogaea TaxID=3818 RepID=A0A444Y493_ARAHY|nr:hypothetical protein Ahy_B08g092578 isoform B [Arachis hypogaea]